MAINKIIILLGLYAVSIVNVAAQSLERKTITLSSLEGRLVQVNIELDNVNDKVILRLNSSETLCIEGYRGLVEDIKITSERFITLNYRVRGGSGIKMQRFVMVCIAKDSLYKAMDIISMQSYELKSTYDIEADSLGLYNERGIYKVSFVSPKNSKQRNYLLKAIEYEKIESKHDPNKNHETTDTLNFRFDDKNKVFYTRYKSLKGSFIFEDSSGKQIVFKSEKYPLIKLKNEEYIFIDNIWYILHENHLLEVR